MRLPVVASLLLLAPAVAGAYTLSDNKWDIEKYGPVEYWVSSRGTPDITDDSHVQAVVDAFHAWECVPCSTARVKYMGKGPSTVAQDGKNAVVWISNRNLLEQIVGAGNADAFLTVSVNFDPMAHPFFEQDIVLNDFAFQGKDLVWTTSNPPPADVQATDGGPPPNVHLDVQSAMLREAGLFLGLAQNCDAQGTCRPIAETVLTNVYGGVVRELRQDDKDGICALYPGHKDSCETQRLFESCEKDCDCDNGFVCVPDGTGRMCSRTCNAQSGVCPNRTGCVLVPGQQEGLCLRVPDGSKKALGMSCTRDNECEVNNCSPATALGRLVCTQTCANDGNCPQDYTCQQGTCLLPAGGDTVPCAAPDAGTAGGGSEDGAAKKGCAHASAGTGTPWVAFALGAWLLSRRRRT